MVHAPKQVPKANCSDLVSPSRAASLSLSSTDFPVLHPEEADWLNSRLNLVAARIRKRLPSINLNEGDLTYDQARIKIAVTHSGGGPRSMFHSTGNVRISN